MTVEGGDCSMRHVTREEAAGALTTLQVPGARQAETCTATVETAL